jgi:hypothetical protein
MDISICYHFFFLALYIDYLKMSNCIHNGHYSSYQQGKYIGASDAYINNKSYKMALIGMAHTLRNPRAVMIHL